MHPRNGYSSTCTCGATTPTSALHARRPRSPAPCSITLRCRATSSSTLFRPQGALTQDAPVGVLDTHGAVEQHDADTDEKQRRGADASADRWSVATARVRDIDTALRHCASALDGVAPNTPQPQRVAAVHKAIAATMQAAQPNKARRAFAESTIPSHAVPLPPARLGPSDDHFVPVSPPTARPSEWRTWARSVRDLQPAWAAAQAEASTVTCVTLATPATLPPTLALPSSLQRAYVILMWSSGCAQAPFAASHRLYSRGATWPPYGTRSSALRQHVDANKPDPTLPQ